MSHTKISVTGLISCLHAKIDEALGALIPMEVPCALIEFPNYSNSGDSAIWLGERKWLAQNKNPVVYVCNKENYRKEILAGIVGNGIILLQGGGNFGDLWSDHQDFREQVIRDFPGNKIIQLPQTIYFNEQEKLERSKKILDAHPDLTLCCRDLQTLSFAQKEFQTKNVLCPDMAFVLGNIQVEIEPKYEVVWLSRTDKESQNFSRPIGNHLVKRTDWLEEPFSSLNQQFENLLNEIELEHEKWSACFPSLISLCDAQAKERFLRGCTILAEGKMVITDRLHAHILCLLLGIPHIVFDNNYGKIKNFYETWTANNELTRWAHSVDDLFRWIDDPSFQKLLQSRGVNINQTSHALNSLEWTSLEQDTKKEWLQKLAKAKEELATLIKPDETLLLVDDDLLKNDLVLDNIILPFTEQDGVYWGAPEDSISAISQLEERCRNREIHYLAFAWPAFWWLEHYQEFAGYLHQNFQCIVKNSFIILFRLKK